MKKAIAILLAMLMLMGGAMAQHIEIIGEECPIPISAKPGAEAVEVPITELEIMGVYKDETLIVLYGENEIGYVNRAALEKLLTQLELGELRTYTNLGEVNTSSPTKDKIEMQAALAAAGFPGIAADGKFGAKTFAAIAAFQRENGLVANQVCNLKTRLLMDKRAYEDAKPTIEVQYPESYDAAVLYAPLIGITDANLEPFASADWKLNYDEFEGAGEIASNKPFASYSYDAVPIDRISMEAYLNIAVADAATGKATLMPTLKLKMSGAFGVYVKSVMLKRGNRIVKLEDAQIMRGVQGINIMEEATFALTEEAMELLGAADMGTLTVRVTGCNRTFDLDAAENEERIAVFVGTCADGGIKAVEAAEED